MEEVISSEACSPREDGDAITSKAKRLKRCTPPRVEHYPRGEALKFAVSPIVLSAKEAVDVYECLLKLNKFHKDFEDIDIQALKSLVKPMETIYREYLGVTWRFVETDLVSMVSYTLDYYIKQVFVRDLSQYERIFVPHLFKDTRGNSVRYCDVLREYERLSSRHGRLSSHENAAFTACSELLKYSERKLVHDQGLKFGSRNIRNEMKHFIGSDVRAMRMFGTHLFTSMIWEDFSSPLGIQKLYEDLPRAKADAFRFRELQALRAMLLRALVLEDMVEKFNNSILDPACRHIHQCGLVVVKAFISKHVPYSFEVRFKNLRTQILKENEAQHDITVNHIFDLETFAALV